MIRKAELQDLEVLKDMFWTHISGHTEYISHGELQMGVGVARNDGGELVTGPSASGKEYWMKYISGKFSSPDAEIFVSEDDGRVSGFCDTEITEDGAAPFGIICDILVDAASRGRGTGGALLEKALSWLRDRGIEDVYLESGKNNAEAHEFFIRRGFVHVSDVFKLA